MADEGDRQDSFLVDAELAAVAIVAAALHFGDDPLEVARLGLGGKRAGREARQVIRAAAFGLWMAGADVRSLSVVLGCDSQSIEMARRAGGPSWHRAADRAASAAEAVRQERGA